LNLKTDCPAEQVNKIGTASRVNAGALFVTPAIPNSLTDAYDTSLWKIGKENDDEETGGVVAFRAIRRGHGSGCGGGADPVMQPLA
jgi:hypothetical protein